MGTYRADVRVTETGSYFPVTIESGSISTAKQAIIHIYRPINIKNIREVSSNSSSGDSEASLEGTGALIGMAIVIWLFMTFTPWILMAIGGGIGTWIGEKVTGMTVEEYTETNDDSVHGKAAIILALALILGGVGFVKGTEAKNYFDTPESSPPAQTKQAK